MVVESTDSGVQNASRRIATGATSTPFPVASAQVPPSHCAQAREESPGYPVRVPGVPQSPRVDVKPVPGPWAKKEPYHEEFHHIIVSKYRRYKLHLDRLPYDGPLVGDDRRKNSEPVIGQNSCFFLSSLLESQLTFQTLCVSKAAIAAFCNPI